jgi:hypothetical protein
MTAMPRSTKAGFHVSNETERNLKKDFLQIVVPNVRYKTSLFLLEMPTVDPISQQQMAQN